MSRNSTENAGVMLEIGTKDPTPAVPGVERGGPVSMKLRLAKGALFGVLIGGVAVLGWLSLYLAAMRIYQVDECTNVFVAQLLKTGGAPAGTDLFQIFLSWVIPTVSRSADLFASARILMLLLFWVNWMLLATATGEKLFSLRWLVAMAGAATLAPLWDYGFEVRHDNLLLAGVLLMWSTIRFKPPQPLAYFLVGAFTVGLEFVTFKAFVYTVPISLAVLVFPPPGREAPRWKLIASWCVGAVAAFCAARLMFKLAGIGNTYLTGVQSIAALPTQQSRFWPFDITLSRLLVQTPLLVAMAVAAVAAFLGELICRKRAAFNWQGNAPEVALFGVALAALFVNPNPYPYNLLHLVPYAFLLAFRYGSTLWGTVRNYAAVACPIVLAVVVFTHLIPFYQETHRHWSMANFRQEALMNLTENLTDAQKDTVFDGIGMVPMRKEFDSRGFIHGQSLKNLVTGPGPHIRDMLAANPPAVVILSYRTDWLPDEDHAFIKQRYVEMADDYLVLGNLLPAGGGSFQVFHAGRYRITSAEGSNIIGTYDEPKGLKDLVSKHVEPPPLVGTVDGVPLTGKPVELSVGTHRIECSTDHSAAVVWVGPHVDQVQQMPNMNHRALFVNWY